MKPPLLPLLSLALLVPRAAQAQANYRSAPTGGRSALMGQTGVALGRDGSAAFVNPATIVRINDASLAFSVNFYTFNATHFSGWHQPGAVDASRFGNVSLDDTGISANRLDALPSTLCLFFTVAGGLAEAHEDPGEPAREGARGRQKLALCLGDTEHDELSLTSIGFRATTIGIGSYGDAGELLLGTELSYRWGSALAANAYVLPNQFAVVDTQTYGAMLILAGSTSLRSITRAVEKARDIVAGPERK